MVGTPSDRHPSGFLLDTNVVVAALGREWAVLARVEGAAGALYVPAIALGELHFGARKSTRVEENLRRIEGFAARAQVLPCDEETAHLYGEVKDGLRRRGRPIPENDIWIATVALSEPGAGEDDQWVELEVTPFAPEEGLR